MPKRDNGDLAQRLLEKALADQRTVEHLVEVEEVANEIVGFHAQQAVEKLLKAVLAARSIDYPRTHDIDRLVEILTASDISPPPQAASLETLTPWATEFRYEDASGEAIDRAAAAESIRAVRA